MATASGAPASAPSTRSTTATSAASSATPGDARLWFSVALGVVAVVLIGWLATLQPEPTRSPWLAPRIASYTEVTGTRIVTLSVEVREGDRLLGAYVDSADEFEVRVGLKYDYTDTDPDPDGRIRIETIDLVLDAPLGDRVLLDEYDNFVPNDTFLPEEP